MTWPADEHLLERNIRALARMSPKAAQAVAEAAPRVDARFASTEDGVPTCRITIDGTERALASGRRPLREANRLAEQADPSDAAIFAVIGFGLGYHVDAMAGRLAGAGLVLCYEPDVGLLRAVLERVDCTACFESERVIILHEVASSDDISARLKGLEGVLALGLRFVSHPPSATRIGRAADEFGKHLVDVIAAAKTSIVTILMQTEKTFENTLANAVAYDRNPGVNDLQGVLSGVPGIVVSAGPSLVECMPVLERPETRERACIVAAQPVLKPLLERGIKPHFVTALDYHDISARFYEGLTAEMVEGVTLVAEPKANPAILAAWPGRLRLGGDQGLDRLLGTASHAPMRGGTTVAHLSYYLARYLGCDPVLLVGQDLAYTDGLYYGAGAAIHNVWAAELGEFRSLEMMELERIGRAKRILRTTEDAQGRAVFTDEQLHTYRLQFERDFAEDDLQGLRTIDAGRGASKAHTTPMDLSAALEQYGSPFTLPETPSPSHDSTRALEALAHTAAQAKELAGVTRETEGFVRDLDAFGDTAAMNERVRQIHELRDRAEALDPAYFLTQHLNQTGSLRRAKRDRAIAIASDEASEREIQAKRIERDADNLAWIGDAADQLAELMERSTPAANRGEDQASAPPQVRVEPGKKLPAVIWLDPQVGGLNQRRDVMSPAIEGLSLAEVTVRAVAQCERVSDIVLICTDTDAGKAVAARLPDSLAARVEPASKGLNFRRRAIGAARALSPASFRGGLASLTAFDEVFDPAASLALIDDLAAPGLLVLGADWCLVDPALTDRVAERLLVDPEARHVAFAQAPAGIAACALARPAIAEVANNLEAGPLASIGGLLAYAPHVPRPDPIAREICVSVDPELRDLGRRLVIDSDDRRFAFHPAILEAARGNSVLPMLKDLAEQSPQRPTHLRAILADEPDEELRSRVLAFARGAGDSAITLDCEACGFTHSAASLAQELRSSSTACVHIRTPLAWGQDEIDRLQSSEVDIISIDVTDPDFPPALEEFPEVPGRGMGTPWIVPRLRRNEAMLPTLLEQYDTAIMSFGSAVIDADTDEEASRLSALPLPERARYRLDREDRRTEASGVTQPAAPA
ncbi:MAG: motility associated factor glycosyltransferase family protein [Phycisphaerales bacterium]